MDSASTLTYSTLFFLASVTWILSTMYETRFAVKSHLDYIGIFLHIVGLSALSFLFPDLKLGEKKSAKQLQYITAVLVLHRFVLAIQYACKMLAGEREHARKKDFPEKHDQIGHLDLLKQPPIASFAEQHLAYSKPEAFLEAFRFTDAMILASTGSFLLLIISL
ncbi:hypothetical protein Slin15195_G045730 [Septoria linicola]|uniref:Uncharacterized protein n=1 Tax=Septoria linicola TaxID=215465 RepID=A0A9Q9EIM7_9PEZI|nr:hypothetical protein Slin14017_G049250 [Septoria linicola]USW51254.1 hypothetical protein Slin15195_G045730 [Septoria linicola]